MEVLNNSIINIEGIHADSKVIYLEHSTDTSHLLTIRDEQGNEIDITIINREIKEIKHGKGSSSKHEQ